jgi:hypothetical protein
MKIKNLVTVLLVTIVLASCAPTTTPVPTISSIFSSPVPTLTITVLSPTPKPATETPAPTTTVEIKNYEPQTVQVSGKVNLEEFTDVDILVQEGFYIRKWSNMTTVNNETIAIVDISENSAIGKLFFVYSMVGSSGLKDRRVDQWNLDEIWYGGLNAMPFKGENDVVANTGNNPSDFLKFNNAFEGVLNGKLGNQMVAFALSGGTNTSLLPKFPGIPYPVLFTYRLDWNTK